MCICKNCAWKGECEYYEDYVEKNIGAVEEYSASVQFSGERDPYLEAVSEALEKIECEFYEEKK